MIKSLALLLVFHQVVWAGVSAEFAPRLLVERSTSGTINFKYFPDAHSTEVLGGRAFSTSDLELLARLQPEALVPSRLPPGPLSKLEDVGILGFGFATVFELYKIQSMEILGDQDWLMLGGLLGLSTLASVILPTVVARLRSANALKDQGVLREVFGHSRAAGEVPLAETERRVARLRRALERVAWGTYNHCFTDLGAPLN